MYVQERSVYLTMVVYIGTPEAPNVRPSLSSPPVTTQGYPVKVVVLDIYSFILQNVMMSLAMISSHKPLSKPSQTFFCCSLTIHLILQKQKYFGFIL